MTSGTQHSQLRRATNVLTVLALGMIATSVWLVVTCSSTAAWVLSAESFAVVVTTFVMRADLRAPQGHQVK